MSMNGGFPQPGSDPFTQFWTDFSQKMMSAGMPTPAPSPTEEAFGKVRQLFFESMSQHAEQFMRSEAFLSAMKQAMDNGLAWQQMMNQTLQKSLAGAQMPTREDANQITVLIRGMEDRILDRLEDVCRRVEVLEGKRTSGKNG